MDNASHALYVGISEMAALIVRASVNLAKLVEESADGEGGQSRSFSDADFQSIVAESTILFLHVLDREIFRLFGTEYRRNFMNSLILAVSKRGSETGMTANHHLPPFVRKIEGITVVGLDTDLYNLRQTEYAVYKLLPAEGEPRLSGKLTWEFGKYVKTICDSYGRHPASQFEAMTVADSTCRALIGALAKTAYPQKKIGFLARLFGVKSR
jgi:hypothetical protein